MKNSGFARFARAFFIFARFARAFFIFVHFTVVTYQFNSRITSTHFTSQLNWNIRETIAETRSCFFGWSPHCPSTWSLLMRQQRLPSKNVTPLVCEKKWQVKQRRATDLTEGIKKETTNRGTCTGNPNDPEDSPRTYIPAQAPETAEWRCQIPDAEEYKRHPKTCLFQAKKFIHCVTVHQRHRKSVISCSSRYYLVQRNEFSLIYAIHLHFKKSLTSLKLTHALRAYTLSLLVPLSYFS